MKKQAVSATKRTGIVESNLRKAKPSMAFL
jgi:hypothetical protein